MRSWPTMIDWEKDAGCNGRVSHEPHGCSLVRGELFPILPLSIRLPIQSRIQIHAWTSLPLVSPIAILSMVYPRAGFGFFRRLEPVPRSPGRKEVKDKTNKGNDGRAACHSDLDKERGSTRGQEFSYLGIDPRNRQTTYYVDSTCRWDLK